MRRKQRFGDLLPRSPKRISTRSQPPILIRAPVRSIAFFSTKVDLALGFVIVISSTVLLWLALTPSPAEANTAPDVHCIESNCHGHVASTEVHCYTDHSHDWLHASCDNLSMTYTYCAQNGVDHVHCDHNLDSSQIRSHHTGPHISSHYM